MALQHFHSSTDLESEPSKETALLEESLAGGGIGVCVKDSSKRVLMQNELVRRACGDQVGNKCAAGCMDLYAKEGPQQWKDWGSHVYKNSIVHGGFYDVTLLCTSERIISFLQPLKEKYEAALAYYKGKGLTKRETEVISLTIRGISNVDICENLSISNATLRTHLNNIYSKLRKSGESLDFIPANRVLGCASPAGKEDKT